MNGAGGALWLIVGAVVGLVSIRVLVALARACTVEVEDEEAVLVTSFGRLVATLTAPGLHVVPTKLLPWVKLERVSLRRDFRHFEDVHVNDARGTTVIVDLWLELRVTDPVKALYAVSDWNGALQNLVAHSATSILGNRDFRQILCDRTELGTLLQEDIAHETARWGLTIDFVFIRNVSLLPEISRQIFDTIAARLERAKQQIEEEGRLRVAELEAETARRVATLVATAKGQYPLAVGGALAALKAQPAVFGAYDDLYKLSLLRPHRTVAFRGFAEDEVRAADAMMIPIANGDGASAPRGDGAPRTGK